MNKSNAVSENKSVFRQKILDQIRAISFSDLQSLSEEIENNLKNLFVSLPQALQGLWAGYKPLRTEPQVDCGKIESINTQQLKWAYPKTSDSGMSFYLDVSTFAKSSNGVIEPQDGKPVTPVDLKGICVPALAYHTDGYRLGRGAGFYDRHFENFQGIKVGVCFDFCFSSAVPFEPHDLKMNYVVTDKKIYQISQVNRMEKN